MSLLDAGLTEQASAIASGEADPRELLDATLSRIDDRKQALNAIVDTFPEESHRMLDEAPRGPLYGVPIAVKDEWPLPWRAERLGAAAPLGPAPRPGESGPYGALRDAGAVIVGIANMHEYGMGSTGAISVYGPARNPWDADRCPGGSSSGSAAAVAGRLVAGAVGADGIGSIRFPAAYCGLTGLKPTFGRSAMSGHHVRHTTTIVSGPLCRDAADCRLLGTALFGEELRPLAAAGLRIGIVRGEVWEDCREDVRTACEAALEALREATGGTMSEVSVEGLEHTLVCSILMTSSEEMAQMTPEGLEALGDGVSPIARAVLRYRMLTPAVTIARAQQVRTLVRRSLATVFEQVDVLEWPTVAAPAPPLADPTVRLPSGPHPADHANPRQAGIANLTGVPGISIPIGLSSEGLPLGLQLLAAWGRDELLLDAAQTLERASDRSWVEAVPPPVAAA